MLHEEGYAAFFTLATRSPVHNFCSYLWVHGSLTQRGLPIVETGSYYVKSFRVEGELPADYDALRRDDIVRLCFKPPMV